MKSKSIGQNVKRKRISLGLSQEALAEKSGISLRTIQRIEKDETTPRGETLQLLATALGTNPNELIDWEEREDKNSLVILNLSMLCFLIFSLLGLIVPLVLWISQKDTVKGVKTFGRKIINFQITLNLIVFILFLIGFIGVLFKLTHFQVAEIANENLIISIIIGGVGTNIYCLIVTLINAYRIYKDKEVWYKPAIPFLK